MTYNTNSNKTCVGSCQYTCQRTENGYALYFPITVNSTSQLNEFMCRRYNRQGQLCGSCVPGYAPPVYSYYLSCVNCTTSNWGKYTAVSLLPLTAFFVFVVTFRLSATSPKLNGFILCIQILTSPPNMRALANKPPKYSILHLNFLVRHMEPGLLSSGLHSVLPAASYKHSPCLGSGLSRCCLPSPTHHTLLPAGPAL